MKKKLNFSDRKYNYVLLAENAYLSGKKERAIEFYKKAIQFKGDIGGDIAILYNIAQIYDEIDKPIYAIETYKR